jgi:F-type H+-transporting ATPase subunit b
MFHLLNLFGESTLPLGIDPQAFIIQLITFVIAFLVLRKWAFGPIVKKLDERRKLIEGGISLGESMRAKEIELEAKVASAIHDARARADDIIATAEADAKKTVQAAEDAARTRADSIISEAKAQIRLESEREGKRLESKIVELVSDVSEAIIGQKVDAKKDAALITKALRERKAA